MILYGFQTFMVQSNKCTFCKATSELSVPLYCREQFACSVAVAPMAMGDASLFRSQLPDMLCSSYNQGNWRMLCISAAHAL